MPVRLQGTKALNRRFRKLRGASFFVRTVAQNLYLEAELIMGKSKKQCPVDQSTLKNSGHVWPPEITSSEVKVTMGYGGAAESYAIYVHERITSRKTGKKIHHPVGKAKFLEDPFLTERPKVEARMATKIRGSIQRLTRTGKIRRVAI